MFKVRGRLYGRECEVTWHDSGVLTGDEAAVVMIIEAASAPGAYVDAPGGVYFDKNLLDDPRSAFLTVCRMLQGATILDGEVPPLPEVPEGAIP